MDENEVVTLPLSKLSSKDRFPLEPGWRDLLIQLECDPDRVIERAGLSPQHFEADEIVRLASDDYFRFCRAMEAEAADPALPLRIADSITVDTNLVPCFAALSCSNLVKALRRIARYKALAMPIHVQLTPSARGLVAEVAFATTPDPPPSLFWLELACLVRIARLGLAQPVAPIEVAAPMSPPDRRSYETWFGVPIRQASAGRVTFAQHHLEMPFTGHPTGGSSLTPAQVLRIQSLECQSSMAHRVRAVLLVGVAGGCTTADEVARRLGLSKRTLQRRLQQEDLGFQVVLDETRLELARHYLSSTRLGTFEIAFMLGYREPNSFARAFRNWTGTTPERARHQWLETR